MSIVDIAVAVVVLIDLWRGFRAGAIATALTLVGWLLALVIGSRFADDVAPFFVAITNNPVLQIGLGFLAVCLIVIGVVHLLAYTLQSTLKALHLSFLDKLAGGVLGAGKGLLKVLVILSLVAPLLTKLPVWQESTLSQNLLPLAPVAKQLVYATAGETWQQLNQNSELPQISQQPKQIE
ncbi:MAG: CvpA family protein [Moraxella sp.]|nr:CvpA family protein [Moraxella sp.]